MRSSGENTFRCQFLRTTPGEVFCCRAGGHSPSEDHLWCPLTPIKQHCTMCSVGLRLENEPLSCQVSSFQRLIFTTISQFALVLKVFLDFTQFLKKKKKKNITHPLCYHNLSLCLCTARGFFLPGQKYRDNVSVGVKTSK